MNEKARLVELERRLANLIRFGVVQAVQANPPRVKVTIGALLTAWLPWLTARAGANATWWPPEVGEQVLVLSPSGDMAQAMVAPASYQTAHPAPDTSLTTHVTQYSDGTVIKYDTSSSLLSIISTGKVTIQCSELDLTGNLKVTGTVTSTGDIAAGTPAISLEHHTHSGVQTGSGTSGPPTP